MYKENTLFSEEIPLLSTPEKDAHFGLRFIWTSRFYFYKILDTRDH